MQTVTLANPTPRQPVRDGHHQFPGRARLQPDADRGARTDRVPARKRSSPAQWPARDIARSSRSRDRDVVYNAPIIATGNGPFDVVHHTNTEDRVLGIHIGGPAAPGQFFDSWADMLFVKGFDSGEPIIYLSTDAGQPLTAVLERSTYVPALNNASFNGGDDFLGSARERLFGFINGRPVPNNPKAQGFQHLALDGFVGDDASAGNSP